MKPKVKETAATLRDKSVAKVKAKDVFYVRHI
jgi:hypothetical protein